QAVGYMLDVWHKKVEAERSFSDYMLFVSFFPQIASGPISKASELLPQIKRAHPFVFGQAKEGLRILLWGMFLKVVVADRLGIYVNTVYDHYTHYSGLTCFVASVLYSIQIYGDFAGYSFMAVGIAKTLGFDLVSNFERPYLAPTITEFWRRWHISLTRWLTAHVYIPLGGSRSGKIRTYWNILVTFIVSGIWHGANWTFVVWGLLHGFFQIVEKALGVQKCEKGGAVRFVRILITFLCVDFAWIFFRMPDVSDAFAVIGRIFTSGDCSLFLDTKTNTVLTLFAFATVVLKDGIDEFFPHLALSGNHRAGVRWATWLMLFMSLLLFGVLDSGQFIYVSF
ncbi:MAG: MBOAT family protein, partial [Bacteroides sp.]|nr:MBOAT family protein [Roseburia sp.]MCM1346359.1 MBOAT family protein [Bacteroides sp.]MCM1420294.1 MBOAT family protein [Bacteroides sp.]